MAKSSVKICLLILALTLGLAGNAAADYTWYSYGGHEYAFSGEYLSWTSAEAEAVSLGGHLVSINDAAESTWVLNTLIVGFNTWIGLNRVGENWVWSSGEPVTYTHWLSSYPVEISNYNYADIYSPYSGGWANWFDDAAVNFIIERTAAVPVPTAVLLLGSGLAGLAAWRRRRG